jgi:hypothetical protein
VNRAKSPSVALKPSHPPTRAPPIPAMNPAALVYEDQSLCTQAQ